MDRYFAVADPANHKDNRGCHERIEEALNDRGGQHQEVIEVCEQPDAPGPDWKPFAWCRVAKPAPVHAPDPSYLSTVEHGRKARGEVVPAPIPSKE